MRNLEIFYQKDGNLQDFDNPNLAFCDENESTVITAHLPEGYETAEKYAYISAGNGIVTGVIELGSGNPVELALTAKYMPEGKCTVGFEAVEGDKITRFKPLVLDVSGFVNTAPFDVGAREKLFISIADVKTLESGEKAYVNVVGNGKNPAFSFGLPKGAAVELGTDEESIIWRETGGEWKPLVALDTLTEKVTKEVNAKIDEQLGVIENGSY